jgi:hypothetical protein
MRNKTKWMKRLVLTGITAISILCVITLYSGISHSGVVDSMHDLSFASSGGNFNFMTLEVCVFCHTPHNSETSVLGDTYIANGTGHGGYQGSGDPLLLWNRQLSSVSAGSYEIYESSTLDATINQVRAYSLLCLSCHDGVGAMNIMTSPPSDPDPATNDTNSDGYPDPKSGSEDQIGDVNYPVGIANANIGERDPSGDTGTVNLTNDHPISFDYTSTLAATDQGLYSPAAGLVGANNLRLYTNPSGTTGVSLECPTCHDVHNQGTKAAGDWPFLVMSNDGSDRCLNCHIK